MNLDEAIDTANIGAEEGLRGMYPAIAKMLADEVSRLRKDIAAVRASAQMGGVYLQSARDGVWAHFRIAKGPAYSVCLSNNPWSRDFAIDYAKAHLGLLCDE